MATETVIHIDGSMTISGPRRDLALDATFEMDARSQEGFDAIEQLTDNIANVLNEAGRPATNKLIRNLLAQIKEICVDSMNDVNVKAEMLGANYTGEASAATVSAGAAGQIPEIDLATASWKANAIMFQARATKELLYVSDHVETDEALTGVGYNLQTIAEAAEYLAVQISLLDDDVSRQRSATNRRQLPA
jgi:hypothetical protein